MNARPLPAMLFLSISLVPLVLKAQSADPLSTASQDCTQFKVVPTPGRITLPEDDTKDLIIHKVAIKYPGVAKAAHISGIVILQATITTEGNISSLGALCGPKILQEAAMKAVRKWKYRPYLIHGTPVELETTITSNFRLGSAPKNK